MFIYVVKTGDSLFSVATKYQVNIDSIRITNGLKTQNLVPGQDLLIPTNVYIVQPGDSLYTIGQMALVPVETIRVINGLHSDVLTIGMRLYLPPRVKYETENFSYLTPSTPARDKDLIQRFAFINSYYGVFEYHILNDGSLSTLNDKNLSSLIRQNQVAPIAVITNLTDTGFSVELARRIISDPNLRQRAVNNIYNLVKNKNYAGANIDFEGLEEQDRDNYTTFIRLVREQLKPEGYTTSVALPAKTSDSIPWMKGYDYRGIGAVSDFVFLMAYDWHHLGSLPGPVAPIEEVKQTIQYAKNAMGGKKVILGVPRYGYDWTMASNGTVISARAISVASAVETAMRHQVPIQYSIQYQQPHFEYWEAGNRHVVWFEDARARAQKLQAVVDYGLLGIGAWKLGLEFPQSAYLISEFLSKRHVI
ncbi:glycoside hydrolase family 18 protein [Viridibacillus sp. YIM B01967]|uniref:Glycoside hydrolase family 18 protein n=1 Tax=Viridibacillus soli TaxID=2798301 RepID=A0ABS1HA44_9BACL|nr:glycosyl hydrolase family 18 protein [Viridibacillus soli]MBK3496298.1 glycoside hydrolase family 18 protein [Viridibacillus soli]